MKHLNKAFILVAVAFLAIQCTDKPQWITLFNGENLEGWEIKGGKAPFIIDNREIIGETVEDEDNTFLCTKNEYGDFILELELNVDTSMNSGIQFRSHSYPKYKNGRVHGYQMEVDPSARCWSGGIYDEGRRGWICNLENNPEAKKAFKNGEWNRYRIEALGNRIRTYVNRIPTADLIDSINDAGFIALQVHGISAHYKEKTPGVKIKWRNIRILTKNVEANCWQSDQKITQVNLNVVGVGSKN